MSCLWRILLYISFIPSNDQKMWAFKHKNYEAQKKVIAIIFMDRAIKNSTNQHILNLLAQGKQIIEKYEDKYLEGEAKDILKNELEKVRDELVDIQNRRILDLINKHQTLDNLQQEEYKVQNEMTDLIMKINELIGSEAW